MFLQDLLSARVVAFVVAQRQYDSTQAQDGWRSMRSTGSQAAQSGWPGRDWFLPPKPARAQY